MKEEPAPKRGYRIWKRISGGWQGVRELSDEFTFQCFFKQNGEEWRVEREREGGG